MKKLLLPALMLSSLVTFSQEKLVKMSLGLRVCNPLENEFAPKLSADEKHMIFMQEDTRKGLTYIQYSQYANKKWNTATDIEILNKNPKLLYKGGYCLDVEGKTMFYTSAKYGGVGNYDIWMIERNGTSWGAPMNLGKPINSEGWDVHPSLSADGTNLYFARHTSKVSNESVSGGKIYVADRKGGDWHEPVALPAPINTGHETNPTILADGVTLIFASNRAGGKGGFDLYMSRFDGAKWSDPINLEFLNTAGDDLHAYVPMSGSKIFFDRKEKETHDLYMGSLPDKYRPLPVMYVKGKVREAGTKSPLTVFVQANDASTNKNIYYSRTDKMGWYSLILRSGIKYDFSIQVTGKQHAFHSDIIDLTDLKKFKWRSINAEIPKIKSGAIFNLNTVGFKQGKDELTDESDADLVRLTKLLAFNKEAKIKVTVTADKWVEDTLMSSTWLTESRIDTVEIRYDTIRPEVEETTEDEMAADSTLGEGIEEAEEVEDVYTLDTVYVTKKFYHNDISDKRAEKILAVLKEKGVAESRIEVVGKATNKLTGKREDKDYDPKIEFEIQVK